MGIGLTRIRQVKLPVTDLARSTAWYRRAFELELAAEFAEEGTVRGVALADPETGFVIALRERTAIPGEPVVGGLDVFALEVASPDALRALVSRWDELGIDHSEVLDSGPFGLAVDVPDPDDIRVRLLAANPIGQGGFHGIDFRTTGPELYPTPRTSN